MDSLAVVCDRTVRVAIGPELSHAGSWQWIGATLVDEWSDAQNIEVSSFQDVAPGCDVCLFVKWLPELAVLESLSTRSSIVYCPIDVYGSGAEIDADWRRLRCCDQIVLHTPFLEKYFRGYAPTACLDHHLRFVAPLRTDFVADGSILWTGVWRNLEPLVEWINHSPIPYPLWILTNFDGHTLRKPADFGFKPDLDIRIEEWDPARHLERLSVARAVIDVKGHDFRQRYKPATKAMDAIASGVPFAVNRNSSTAGYLAGLGFDVAAPDDLGRWLSREYWEQTRRFGDQLRERLSLPQIADRWEQIISSVAEERGVA